MKKPFFITAILFVAISNCIYAQNEINFDPQKPLFKFQNEQLTNESGLLRYAALTGYREGVKPVQGQFNVNFEGYNDDKAGTRRIYMYNLSIQDMLTHGLIKPSQILLEVKDPSKFRYDPKYGSEIEWLRKNGYCYELLLPIGALKGMYILDNEIQKAFNVWARWEKRNVKTWILVRTSSAEKFKASGGVPLKDPIHGIYQNVNIAWIGASLNEFGPTPFLDETGYKDLININLGVNLNTTHDFTVLRKALQKYDLDLKEESREKLMFVITEAIK
ncbi:hypothetical protein [Pedobacter sp. FW305-3-2-15-E-R2A2]|uniref:hypothetical protein n=1 Tax=Pedobacter sp. FW305-3-2-15-E-R2A2 TaxID=3140251 RepID=UPI0031406E80